MRRAFERFDPTGPETPLVVEVPHAGLDIPPPFLETIAAPARSIARDADLYVDRLYDLAPAEGATLLVARASRYAIDVNRSEADVDGEVVEGARAEPRMHHGLIWRTTSDGEAALSRRLTREELDERLNLVWRPYHRELTAIVAQKVATFGVAVVVAAHSMPSIERVGGQGGVPRDGRSPGAAGRKRADVVPGTRGRRSAAPRFIDAMEAHAKEQGWSVRHDDPYAGGFTTQHYGRPDENVHVVQVELARRLYLDESTLRLLPSFEAVRSWCRALVARLGAVVTEAGG
jgi:N-formylglutamate amidohydrolase